MKHIIRLKLVSIKTFVGRLIKRCLRIFYWTIFIFTIALISLRWIDPVTSSVILQHNIYALFTDQEFANQQWVNWEDMTKQLPLAVVASEDQRFPIHHGIDFTELKVAISQGGQRGASTITQQVAKNMFLWQGRSYLRKGLEAGLAVVIDFVWGKQRVLEIYLNIAYFGDYNYGVGAASEQFFDKNPKQLNRFEVARLAAVLPNPHRFSVRNTSKYILDRQQWILKQMKQLGGITYITSM